MDTQTYVARKLKSGHTFLSRWQDCNARIWDYSISHTHITIRLEKEGVKGNLHIVGIEPIRYNGKFKWGVSNFELKHTNGNFELYDEGNAISLICEDIDFFENCKPIY